MDKISKRTIKDLDVYGRNNFNGTALVHENDVAISNAMILWLSSEPDDILYQSGQGCGIRRFLFKIMTDYNASRIATFISNSLDNKFGKFVEDIEVVVTPDFQNKIQQVDIYWTNKVTKKSSDAQFYIEVPKNLLPPQISVENNNQNKIPINYTGDNLIAFVISQLSKSKPTDKLLYSKRDLYWYWGNFAFPNLMENSTEYDELKQMIG